MIKILLLFFIMIFSISCSMDTHSGLWNEKFNEVQEDMVVAKTSSN